MFIALVMTVCAVAASEDCRTEELQFQSTSAIQCLAEAPAQIAQWQHTHPKWRVTRWECRTPGSRPIDT